MKIMKPAQIFRIWASALVLLAAAGVQAAGPWYVATNGLDSNAGTSWAVPYLTISNALTNASASDTIWVSNGVYTLSTTVNNPADKKCLIRAWSTNPADTVLLGHGSNSPPDGINFRGVLMYGSGSLLQGFTVTNFYLTNSNYGAGVYCDAGLISNCVIAGNILLHSSAWGGGGGVNLANGAVIENCSIIGNRVHPGSYGSGGGGIKMDGSNGRISNCRIVGNRVTVISGGGPTCGAGVFAGYYGGFVIQDSVIASNTGSTYGGGIQISGGIVSNCQVFANSADTAAGIYFTAESDWYGTGKAYVRIERCVISNNVALNYYGGWRIVGNPITNVLISQCAIVSNYCSGRATGGGLHVANLSNVWIRSCLVAYNWGHNGWGESGYGGCGLAIFATNALIENCTIVSNRLTGSGSPQGAGLWATNGVRVVNSIIYHNTGATMSNFYAFADCTFSNNCTAPLPSLGTANTDANPQLVAKDTGNFRLAANSPCINTGINQEWMTGAVDLDGRKRIRYGIVDMGAYERIHSGTIYGFR